MKKIHVGLILFLILVTSIGSALTLSYGKTDPHSRYAVVGGEILPMNLKTLLLGTPALVLEAAAIVSTCAIMIGVINRASRPQ